MAGGKVRHWKHGWIPVSPEAKAYVAGHGPKPSSYDDKTGVPRTGKLDTDKLSAAQQRATDLMEVMPELGVVQPHYSFPSQGMRGHYDGGLTLKGEQADTMIRKLIDTEEGTSSRTAANRLAGLGTPLPTNSTSGNEEVARRRARRIAQKLDIPTDGLYPEWSPDLARANGNVPSKGYTGGINVFPYAADAMIKALSARYTGTMTRAEARRAAGR